MKRITAILLVAFAIHGAAQDLRPVGANLTDLSPFGTLWIYTNALKQSSGWLIRNANDPNDPIKTSGELRMELSEAFDSDGYPLQVPFQMDHPEVLGKTLEVSCLVLNGQVAPYLYPEGNYLLVFEGSGTVVIQGDVDGEAMILSEPGAHHIPISNPTALGLEIIISESAINDPVRNVQLIFPEYTGTFRETKFRSDFISLVSDFQVLRYMKPARAENNTIERWDQRTLSSSFSYFLDVENDVLLGMPYEDIIELSNEAGVDPWVSIPYLTNDHFVRSLAELFEDGLDSDRTLHFEYGNEAWNPSYPHTWAYMRDQGLALNLPTSEHPEVAESEAIHRFYCLRMFQVFEIFNEVFQDQSRLVKIHGTQSDPFVAGLIFEAYDLPNINPQRLQPDAVAIASYIGVTLFDDLTARDLEVCDHTALELLDTLRNRVQWEMREMIDRYSQETQARGIDLFAYEGGQHVTEINFQPMDACAENLVAEMNRLPRMGDFFCEVLNTWYDTYDGELFMVFNLAERPDAFGAFGVLESGWQHPDQSSKWQGLYHCAVGHPVIPHFVESSETKELTIYPNPTTDMLHFEWLPNEGTYDLRMYDLSGRLIHTEQLSSASLSLQGMGISSGIYQVLVRDRESLWSGRVHFKN